MRSSVFHGRGWETHHRLTITLTGSKAIALIIFSTALFVAVKHCNAQDITGRIVGTVTDS